MPSWLPAALKRIKALASERNVWFTLKGRREMALLGLDELDAVEILASLEEEDGGSAALRAYRRVALRLQAADGRVDALREGRLAEQLYRGFVPRGGRS